MKVFIDQGHNDSGWNTGASGNGLREQDITYEVAQRLGRLLQLNKIDVQYSRNNKSINLGWNNSTSLAARYTAANQSKANIFISLHCNAGGGTGAETFWYKEDSQKLAKEIQKAYIASTGLKNRGVKKSNFAVISNTKMPAVLLEMGFIDNFADAKFMKEQQEKIAQAIAQGIFQYLGVKGDDEVVQQAVWELNGKDITVQRISKDGHNYVKVDDLKGLLDIGYDVNTKKVSLNYKTANTGILLNNKEKKAETIIARGNNYIRLRTLAELGLFDVDYDADTKKVIINQQ